MSKRHSTPAYTRVKPSKPYPDFPLFAHATGYWAKKIRGRTVYFGPLADPDAALQKYLDQKDALHAGRTPRVDPDAVTVKDVANGFLNHKKALLDAGEIKLRTWQENKEATHLLVDALGKRRVVADLGPDDFAALRRSMAKKWGPHRLTKMIGYIRSVFKHAHEAGSIGKPVQFGPGFRRPSRKVIRLERAQRGPRLFTADEIHRLLKAAGPQLKAMLLLGINCGFGNADCGTLPQRAVDLAAGIIDYPRPKTGIPRRCALWPETVQAIRDALANRSEPKDQAHAQLVFLTRCGLPWAKATSTNPVSQETGRVLKALGINGRKGLGFYTLRHVFRTVADEAKDQPCVDFIMGHESGHMSSVYRETISDARLRAVAEHVRGWLFTTNK
jgi:integrase